MPLQNRALPTGEIVAHPARGLFMGNRGRLHTPAQTLTARRWSTHTWVACVLCFRGRHRQVMGRGYTELFFLDEAVSLAAGHRPCAECRRADYRRFQAAWRAALGGEPTAPAMNAMLHRDRIDPATRRQRRFPAPAATLADGCMVMAESGPALLWRNQLHPFTPGGYRPPTPIAGNPMLEVLTPRCTVAVLRAGYRPVLHPTLSVALM